MNSGMNDGMVEWWNGVWSVEVIDQVQSIKTPLHSTTGR